MRVLFLHEHLTPPGQGGGGAEALLRDEMSGLRRLGHDVAWLNGVGIGPAVAEFRPDVVHVSTVHTRLGFGPVEWLQRNRVPHVWAIMDYWPWCRPRMLLVDGDRGCSAVEGVCDNVCGGRETDLLELVNRSPILALNGYTAAIYRRNGLRVDYVVELGIDVDQFRPAFDPPTAAPTDPTPSIVTSCAWPSFLTKGMHILDRASRIAGVRVHLIAGKSREEVAELLRGHTIYVFPSTYQETFGLSLTEAMASGLACIASDVAGPRAQSHDGSLVRLVPPRDANALAEALRSLYDDPSTAREMGLRARAHVAEDHSLEAMGRRLVEVYRSVLADA